MAYLPLSTANLPDPVIDPAQGSSPEDYFNTVTYTGTGTSGGNTLAVTGVGFQPDFTWIKNRTVAVNHYLNDVIRGTGAATHLHSNNTDSESSASIYATNGGLASLDSDGFTAYRGTDNTYQGTNLNGNAYVAWSWKANGSGVSNTDGSITSTVSANTESGFSIVSYEGNGTAGATIGHGLNQAPDVMIVKNRDNGAAIWSVYHSSNTSAPETDALQLNTTNATGDNVVFWNDTAPTSSVFSVGTYTGTNNSGDNIIAYCFHSVEGFSKCSSYVGNGSNDGSFVYLGFRPAFVMVKRTNSTGEWVVIDSTRNAVEDDSDEELYPNSSVAEDTSSRMDFTSNGFKLRNTSGLSNASGNTYIYMAFAENPFKYSNAR